MTLPADYAREALAAYEALAAHDAEQAQAAKAVPAGFKLVPVEPTLEMLTAAGREDDKAFIDGMPHGATAADTWAAMLAAAPTPPAPEAQQAAGRASVDDWEQELSAVMPADLKDWWQNSRREWPAVAAAVIKSLQRRCDAGWEVAALAQRREPLTDEQIAEGRYRTWAAEPDDAPEAWAFMRGARWAEKHFGIGATTGEKR